MYICASKTPASHQGPNPLHVPFDKVLQVGTDSILYVLEQHMHTLHKLRVNPNPVHVLVVPLQARIREALELWSANEGEFQLR